MGTGNRMTHRITRVAAGSIAEELGIEAGDELLSVNGQEIEDIFDYRYQMNDEYITLVIRKGRGSADLAGSPEGGAAESAPAEQCPAKKSAEADGHAADGGEEFGEDGDSDVIEYEDNGKEGWDAGDEWELEVEKDAGEDLGLEFGSGLMDDYRSCANHCIFCFIDQMPKGMRDTLYFKDDDARLSFLQGNYITLTNMSDHDIDRIIEFRLEPINISIHTTNPELRAKMLHNRFAGQIFRKLRRLARAGIEMNGQIVLCRGINDGAELDRTMRDLESYMPAFRSVCIVPVGLSKYREGLYPLEPFTKEDALELISQVEKWQGHFLERFGSRVLYASDEWYLLAEEELPEDIEYEGYPQLENGVGMLRLLETETREALETLQGYGGRGDLPGDGERYALEDITGSDRKAKRRPADSSREAEGTVCTSGRPHHITIATGVLAYPMMRQLSREIMEKVPDVRIEVREIINHFFGERITVSGLITGKDLREQLESEDLGEGLLLPVNMFRSGERVFLDDDTADALAETLQIPVVIVESSGQALVDAVCSFSRKE